MVNSRNPNEPVAWMRPEITEDGFTYDSSFRDNDGIVLPQTRIGQGFKPLYTSTAIAAARVQAINECADILAEYDCLNSGMGREIRALIGGSK